MAESASEARATHIQATDLSMAYGDFVIQQDLDFEVRRGEVFIIMGGSGCGKSTLLKVMIGLKAPRTGTICYEDEDFWALPETRREVIKRKFGTLFQSNALWSSMTLAENITLPLRRFTGIPEAEMNDIASYKLMLVGLAGYEDYYPSEISGGMQKRAGLARAMAMDPEILFFDEPSAGLDPISSRLLDDLILQLRDTLGTTIVVVSHDLDSIFTIGDTALFLDAKTRTQLATGNPRELRDQSSNPDVRNFLRRGDACEETQSA